MSAPNDPSFILDPRMGSLLVSASGLNASLSGSQGDPIQLGTPAAPGEAGTLGPYRVVRELGRGAMGAVFLAIDTRLDRQLALKVMLPEFAANAEARERFLREARAAAKIGHDNVVMVFEADERDGIPYIAMQLLHGYTLDAFVQKKGSPSLRHVVRIAREATLGLAAAHKLGIVHRDIKPANLWLESPNGRVKLLDFGLARPDGVDSELTKSGVLIGTPAFMSPEQALGERVDHRTDLFSLGAVLYWLSTGQLPFQGANVVAMLKALGTAEPKPVLSLNPKVPGPLAELIHRLLAKSPEGRPQSAAEVANRLHEILQQSASLSSATPGGGTEHAGAQAGNDDPWTTILRSAASQRAGSQPLVPSEPKLLHSQRMVVITPMNQEEESQKEESQKEDPQKQESQKEPEKPTTGPTRTVISSGVVWEEGKEGTEEANRTARPARRVKAEEKEEEEEEEEERDAKRPYRSTRRMMEEEWDGPARRSARARTKGTSAVVVALFIGAGVLALVAVFVIVALIVVGRPKETDLVLEGDTDQRPEPANRPDRPPVRRWNPPPAPPAGPTTTLIPTPGATDVVPVAGGRTNPRILGSIPRDPKFKTIGPAGSLLIGLEVRFEEFGGRVIARAVRPIYRVGGKAEFGEQFGNDLSGSVTLMAREGYAVGGITGKAELWCHGFSLTYMRVKPDGSLDPRDSYESEWAGFNGACTVVRVPGDGTPVVGIVGKIVGPKTTALGLLFKGQEAWDPSAGSTPAAPAVAGVMPGMPARPGPKEVIAGWKTDQTFRDEAPPGGLLVGFDVYYGKFVNNDVINGIRPLYRTGDTESFGGGYGLETERGVRVFAKAGYAVGGVIVKAGLGMDSITIVFMKIKGDRLDPDDSYKSEKLGGPGGGDHPICGGDGTPVTGIIGCLGREGGLTGLGLTFPKK